MRRNFLVKGNKCVRFKPKSEKDISEKIDEWVSEQYRDFDFKTSKEPKKDIKGKKGNKTIVTLVLLGFLIWFIIFIFPQIMEKLH